jgi:transcriptional regulator with XRE-family HTH domain
LIYIDRYAIIYEDIGLGDDKISEMWIESLFCGGAMVGDHSTLDIVHALERRRRELGMSRRILAERSGVCHATINRILAGNGVARTSLGTLEAIAAALDVRLQIDIEARSRSMEFKERQAEIRAKEIAGMIQGTSALESQAIDDETYHELVWQTFHELMAGPRDRLWVRR